MFKQLLSAIFCMLLIFSTISAQTTTDNTEYDVIQLEDQIYPGEFVPGEILIKFKDEVTPVLGKSKGGYALTGIASIDEIFAQYQVTSAEKLFKNAKKLTTKETFTAFTGYTFERPSLHNIQKLEVEVTSNIFEIIEELKNDENVVYAEPNYLYSIVEDEAVSPDLTENELMEWIDSHPEFDSSNKLNEGKRLHKLNVVIPNDPLYTQQWGISACQIDAVWDTTTGDTSSIIAIIDTGVDWLHPDLQNKIWVNSGEVPDNGIDDDGNGFVDDIRGWDYINHDNDPKDDNSHGTHCAGIAAAETDNGIGVAGVNWHAKIMPIKVFQSSGVGDAATITQGIEYASNNGATVLSMSFSSKMRSFTMEDALANAYATSVLVAAAGNSGCCINCICGPRYPAALPYVLGVEATNQAGAIADFSNTDDDGPVYSVLEDLLNYELKAPGVGIMSTIPNGNYRALNGTSMATPLVAGAVSLYRELFPVESQEIMWGNFINTISGHIQLFDAVNAEGEPEFWFVSNTIVDTLDGDADGRVDAGETIELWFMVRNTWGQADSVYVGIRFGEFEDTTVATILKDNVLIGSISAYATRTNEMNTLKIHINPSVVHNRNIVFETLVWYAGATDTTVQQLILNVENGVELSGMFGDTLTLTPDKFWLVSGSFKITDTGVLNILPGTYLEIKSKLVNDGKVIAHGTPDSLIHIKGTHIEGGNYQGTLDLDYVTLELTHDQYIIYQQKGIFTNSLLLFNGTRGFYSFDGTIENSVLLNWVVQQPFLGSNNILISKCNISNFSGPVLNSSDDIRFEYCNFNRLRNLNRHFWSTGYFQPIGPNNIVDRKEYSLYQSKPGYFEYLENQYWGTSDSAKIEDNLFDFLDDAALSKVVFWPYLTEPTDSAHGMVWKILIDGVDPQDEYLDPIGPGEHRFDVYFNRAMDIAFAPSLTFGVREPYVQQAVVDSSSWSADSTVWTAYKTIQLHTGDGINRLRVANARDPEDFEIPIEDQRFEFVIDAAGLSSTDFNAIAGLGKIDLDWKTPEIVEDLLGYNLYRFTNLTDSTYTDTLLLNTELIIDTIYTDFDVIPNDNYYYQYTVIKTDFSESDRSKVVGSMALTASPGDVNGDLSVNVLDITSMVSYLLNNNPQPFIFEAADVDTNGVINVLDIVKTINIILGGGTFAKLNSQQTAELILDENSVRMEDCNGVSALQLKIAGKGIKDAEIIPGDLLTEMEFSYSYDNDTLYVLIYNFKNKTLGGDNGLLFTINKGEFTGIVAAVVGNAYGEEIRLNNQNDDKLVPEEFFLYQNYPNPFNPTTKIKYGLPKVENVEICIYNILGQRIKTFTLSRQTAGYHEVIWNSTNNFNRKVASGVYIYQIKAGKFITQKKMVLLK